MDNGETLRDVALDRLFDGHGDWCRHVIKLIAAYPIGAEFTTDALWSCVSNRIEPRAMGAAIRTAARLGFIQSTARYEKSSRMECHARPVLIWRRT